uniref:Glycosyl hydrolase family 38 C-terminal domain-containing protein n=1 Tax=Strongyloides stercoralis TaxID=6248 RepID=A0A0K0E6W4_STRER
MFTLQKSNHSSPTTPFPSSSPSKMTSSSHLDVDQMLEDYAWQFFKDMQSIKKTKQDQYRDLEKGDVEFCINKKKLMIIHEEPIYSGISLDSTKPYTLFTSTFTNSTNRPQSYSFKTERSTESVVVIGREQGYSLGSEAELTLKTPCEIAEFKAGFKHEIHFNDITENSKAEMLTWAVDSNITVPPNYATEASVKIDEMSYSGKYTVRTILSGFVNVTLRRRRDGALILPVNIRIVELFKENINNPKVKSVASIIDNQSVQLTSKGHCHFQFAVKQAIELKDKALNSIY